MLKENHFINNEWVWHSYFECPCSLDVYVYQDLKVEAAAIVKWKLMIFDKLYLGSTVEELVTYFEDLTFEFNKDERLIIFVENLDYLYFFIQHYFNCDIFDVGGKGICSVVLNDHIELREVKYIGTDNWEEFSAKETRVEKLYDFAKYYWSDIVTKKNILGKTPLTLQQVVTNKIKDNMTKEDKALIADIFPKTKQGYEQAVKYLYIGGYCDGRDDVAETIGHIDFKTSYIARMLTDYYPITPFKKSDIDIEDALKEKCCIIRVKFTDFKANRIKFIHKKRALALSEEFTIDEVQRIISAKEITLLLNELDFELVCNCYTFAKYEIISLAIADRGPLPKYIRNVAEECYKDKETLEGINKVWAKMCTEIVYGATVKALYNIDSKSWHEVREQQPLSPYFGIWTTSHARYALISMVLLLGNDFLYSDTDSIYFKNPLLHVQLIEKYNENRRAKMELYCIKNGLDYRAFSELGTFTYEDGATKDHFTISRFKALGPKRYMYDGECGLVTKVAGYKKQYYKDGKLVNAWEHNFDKDEIFERFEDDTKVKDIQKVSLRIDEPCTVYYEGEPYTAKSYILTAYKITRDSTKERFAEAAEAEEKLKEKQKLLGKEER